MMMKITWSLSILLVSWNIVEIYSEEWDKVKLPSNWKCEPKQYNFWRPIRCSFFNLDKQRFTNSKNKKRGRGVWESNPPGTALSDPPAVLKTVRPTGAPTPPCVFVLCHACLFLSSQFA